MSALIYRWPRFLQRRRRAASPQAGGEIIDMREPFAREQRRNGWRDLAVELDEIVTAIRFSIDMGDVANAAAAIREFCALDMPSMRRAGQRDRAALTLAAALHGREQTTETRALLLEVDALIFGAGQ